MSSRRLVAAAAVVALAVALAGCGGTAPNTIVLYNGQHPQLTSALVSAFTHQTGIHVSVRTGDGIVLADQILQEGSNSPADVYLTENSPELMNLQQHGLLAKLPASITDQVPQRDDSPAGDWVGIALRVSSLAYDPARIARAQLPASILQLEQPQWKGRIAIAPTDSDFVPLVGAIVATYGETAAVNWLNGLKRNAQLYQDDESVVAAVNRGAVATGIINQYYWFRLRLQAGAGSDPEPRLLLPEPQHRRPREHLRRGRARLEHPQDACRPVRQVPRLSCRAADPGRQLRLRIPGPPGHPAQPPASPAELDRERRRSRWSRSAMTWRHRT